MTKPFVEDGAGILGVGPKAKTRTGRIMHLAAAAPFQDPDGKLEFASFMGFMAFQRRALLDPVPNAESRKLHCAAVGEQAETLFNRAFSRNSQQDAFELSDLYLGHLLNTFDATKRTMVLMDLRRSVLEDLSLEADTLSGKSETLLRSHIVAVEACDDGEYITELLPTWQLDAIIKFIKRILRERSSTTA